MNAEFLFILSFLGRIQNGLRQEEKTFSLLMFDDNRKSKSQDTPSRLSTRAFLRAETAFDENPEKKKWRGVR